MSYLATLNDAQRIAVTHPPQVPLQILAGPGSGKTHVLTCRIAHLVASGISPQRICAVTFTNKAANEMKERLQKLIGPDTSKLIMGTFHALCARFLRQYGKAIGLDTNFTICDSEESKKLIAKLLKDQKDYLREHNFELTPRDVASSISTAKSKDLTPAQVLRHGVRDELAQPGPPSPHNVILSMLYEGYQAALKANRALDFDDLLAYGVNLLDNEPRIPAFCEHVLVDEFQDTNVCQYKLMIRLAGHHKRVTIVGDPDQSIYGWRAAEAENLSRMTRDFQGVEQVMLEQNYRSTQSILRTSIQIMSQDKNRIDKSLYSGHHQGSIPSLTAWFDEKQEGDYIAHEIKRLMAHSGGMLKFSDFAVLLRFNALSRAIETSLQREGIPHKVLKGHKFFDRMEIKDLLSYLQLVDNPNFVPAFQRAVNTPPRSIGEKSLSELIALANARQLSAMAVAEGIVSGQLPDIKPPAKRKLAPFVQVIRRLRKDASQGVKPDELLQTLVDLVDYVDYLKKEEDHESRLENVQELVNFAKQEHASVANMWTTVPRDGDENAEEEREIPLRLFLQASMLASDADGDEKGEKDEVIISTCHAAKGLEWPVVFIPAVASGIFPHSRTEDLDEERRLLYVACTRAKGFLYLSHSEKRPQAPRCEVSPFISSIKDQTGMFSSEQPQLDQSAVVELAQLLKRDVPKEPGRRKMVDEHTAAMAARAIQQPQPGPSGKPSYPSDPVPEILSAEFNTARAHPQAQSFGSSFTSTTRAGIHTTTIGTDFSSNLRTVQTRQGFGGFVLPAGSSLSSAPVTPMPIQFGGLTQQPGRRVAPAAPLSQPQWDDYDMGSYSVASSSNAPSLPMDSAKEKPASKSSSKGKTKTSSQANTLDSFVKRSSVLRPALQPSASGVMATVPKSTTALQRTFTGPGSNPLLPAPAPRLSRATQSTTSQYPIVPTQSQIVATAAGMHVAPSIHGSVPPCASATKPSATPPSPTVPRKRLGMGHVTGYVNKKFKSHHLDAGSS